MKFVLTVLTFLFFFIPASRGQSGEWYNDDGGYAFQGAGSRDDPYLVSSASSLVYLAEQVNKEGRTFEGCHFRLTRNLDLGDHYWIPIGADAYHVFNGLFDGKGRTISNLYVGDPSGTTYANAGLFGYVGNGARIENLTLKGGRITGGGEEVSRTGGLVGYLFCHVAKDSDSIIVRNCHAADLAVTAGPGEYANTGGLIGEGYAFCDNDGAASVLIENCTSWGTVSAAAGSFVYTGGIIGKGRGHGYCDGSASASGSFTLRRCFNYGKVEGGAASEVEGISSTGGVLGFGYCTGDGYGDSDASGRFTLETCANRGAVRGGDSMNEHTISYTGGILGYGDGYGYGDKSGVRSGNGYGSGTFTVRGSMNRGRVEGGKILNGKAVSATGGIFGYASATSAGDEVGQGYGFGGFNLFNCYSFANILSAQGLAGGIGGCISASGKGPNHTLSAAIHDSYAAGTINEDSSAAASTTGGIIGRIQKADEANSHPKVEHCLSVLSYVSGDRKKTFRIAGELSDIQTPSLALSGNYAYIPDGSWVDTPSPLNGTDWDGLLDSPPLSEWNRSEKNWIMRDTFSLLPVLTGIPNQGDVPVP